LAGGRIVELGQAVAAYRFAHQQTQECDRQLQSYLSQLPSVPLATPANGSSAKKAKKARKARDNQPTIPNLEAELERICGVNLCTIDGISIITAQTIVSEIGTNMHAFPSEDNFTSWLGLTRGKPVSEGKVIGQGKG
jgi:transposase